MKKNFNKTWGDFYERNYKKSDLSSFVRSYPNYFDYILNSGAKNILEVGVGSGMHTILLSLLNYEITGIDNDEKILELVKRNNQKFGGKANFLQMDAFNLKFPSKSFDLVISGGLLEHYSDGEIGKLLEEQARAGKEVVISLPSIGYFNKDFGNERLLSKEKWLKIIKRKLNQKIEILKCEYDGWRRETIFHAFREKKLDYFFFPPFRWRFPPQILIVLKEKL